MARPTWDETIVPALRKRLESESRVLAKRMSVASIASADDPLFPEPAKSSAIPRPSLHHDRVSRASTSPPAPRRARTCSQPPSPNGFAHNPLPTPDSSRPTSPRTSDVRPTRIPIAARTRTASASSNVHTIARTPSHRPYQPPTPDISHASEPQPMTPPIASIRHHPSSIMNEPAPFVAPSITSSMRSRMQDPAHADPRPSTDSEERPFEHWYRGDVHRNGGVGEFRVAKHVEMLQIANYGHNLRKAVHAHTRDPSGQVDYSLRGRKRADSVGTGTRESLYLDDEPTRDISMVLDESPLTDIEADPEDDPETFYDAHAGVDPEVDTNDTVRSAFSAPGPGPGPPPAAVSPSPSQAPRGATLVQGINTMPKHGVRTASDPLRSNTAPPRTSADSTIPIPRTSAPAQRSRSMSSTTSPTSQSSDHSHTKRRAKSPAASSPASTPKKARTKPKTPPTSRDPRVSVAMYPTPEGDMVNAIPTWTQPVQKSGNWDEVVLPVVARKRGLDGLYERADGSPKLRSPESPPIKPAPGTFGYDYTKYRPPRRPSEEIQMRNFGRIPEDTPPPEADSVPLRPRSLNPTPQPVHPEEPIRPDPRQTIPNPPASPAPFARYRIDQQVLPTINVTRPSSEFPAEQRQELQEDDVTGGCCKCIVM